MNDEQLKLLNGLEVNPHRLAMLTCAMSQFMIVNGGKKQPCSFFDQCDMTGNEIKALALIGMCMLVDVVRGGRDSEPVADGLFMIKGGK